MLVKTQNNEGFEGIPVDLIERVRALLPKVAPSEEQKIREVLQEFGTKLGAQGKKIDGLFEGMERRLTEIERRLKALDTEEKEGRGYITDITEAEGSIDAQ